MVRRRKPRERIPWVAILGWPLIAATAALALFVKTGSERLDPILRLGYGLPALVALLWAFSKVSATRRHRKHVAAVLIAAATVFLLLFLDAFFTLGGLREGPATSPASNPASRQARVLDSPAATRRAAAFREGALVQSTAGAQHGRYQPDAG